MSKNIPVKQHYIPQFILRNFQNENNKVNYRDIKSNETIIMDVKDVFMEEHLYDDKINSISFPQKIEKDLSKFESEVAPIINKFVNDDDITISVEEDEKLKLFFAIMAFRNVQTKEQFINFNAETKDVYQKYQRDENFEDFWKRNLGYLVNCRSLKEVLEHDKIDKPIKVFMMRDTFNFTGLYFVLLEKRGKQNFVIGDCYPVEIKGEYNVILYSCFPISSNRVLMLFPREIKYLSRGVIKLETKDYKEPINPLNIPVRKIYDDKVKDINESIIENCLKGYIDTNNYD